MLFVISHTDMLIVLYICPIGVDSNSRIYQSFHNPSLAGSLVDRICSNVIASVIYLWNVQCVFLVWDSSMSRAMHMRMSKQDERGFVLSKVVIVVKLESQHIFQNAFVVCSYWYNCASCKSVPEWAILTVVSEEIPLWQNCQSAKSNWGSHLDFNNAKFRTEFCWP